MFTFDVTADTTYPVFPPTTLSYTEWLMPYPIKLTILGGPGPVLRRYASPHGFSFPLRHHSLYLKKGHVLWDLRSAVPAL